MLKETVTTNKSLNVTLTDSGGYETTFRLDNPTSDVTLAAVNDAFNYAMGKTTNKSGKAFLRSGRGNLFINMQSAKKVQTVTTVSTLE